MKHMKYILLGLIVAIVASFAIMKLTEVQRAEKNFTLAMEMLKNGDIDKASRYVKDGEIIDEAALSKYEGSKEFIGTLFSKIEYSINSAQKTDPQTIKLNVDFTSPDMKKIFSSSVKDILKMRLKNAFTFGEKKMDDNEVNAETVKILTENLNDSTEEVECNIDINVVKTNMGWKIDAVDSVKDGITGGLLSGIKYLAEALD